MSCVLSATHTRLAWGAALLWGCLISNPAQAERSISLPFSESFDQDNYGDLIWLSGGARFEHDPNGGWQGGGAATFFPPTAEQSYSGLGSFVGLSATRVNVRFLVLFGPTYASTARAGSGNAQNKFLIMLRDSGVGADRFIGTLQPNSSGSTTYYTPGLCHNAVCKYPGGAPGDYWPVGGEGFQIPPRVSQWYCFEYELEVGQLPRLYIWSQDGTLSGEYFTSSESHTAGSSWAILQILGGYFNGYHLADPDNYIKYDALAIDNQLIGPPPGFVGGGLDAGPDQALPDAQPIDQALPDAQPIDQALPDTLTIDQALPDAQPVDQALSDTLIIDQALQDTLTIDQALPDAQPVDQALQDAHPVDHALLDAQPVDQQSTDAPLASDLNQRLDMFFDDARVGDGATTDGLASDGMGANDALAKRDVLAALDQPPAADLPAPSNLEGGCGCTLAAEPQLCWGLVMALLLAWRPLRRRLSPR